MWGLPGGLRVTARRELRFSYFLVSCAGLLFAGLVGYAAYLNHSEGTAALCAKAGLQDAHGALAEKLCRGGKLHVSGDELLAFFNGSALAL